MKIIDDYYKKIRKERKKIAFTGTHCVGKSTIINTLASKSWCEVIPECYRETADFFGLLCNGDTKKQCYDTTLHCFFLQMQKEIELEKKSNKHIICDRTVFDCFLYAEANNKGHSFKTNYKLYNDCKKIAINHLKTYDIIYFIKYKHYPIKDDGFRNLDIDNQKWVHQFMFNNLIKLPNVKFISYQEGLELQALEKINF